MNDESKKPPREMIDQLFVEAVQKAARELSALADSMALYREILDRKTEPIIGHSSINGGARRTFIIENPNTRNARVQDIDAGTD